VCVCVCGVYVWCVCVCVSVCVCVCVIPSEQVYSSICCESYALCGTGLFVVYDLYTSRMRNHWPVYGHIARGKIIYFIYVAQGEIYIDANNKVTRYGVTLACFSACISPPDDGSVAAGQPKHVA